jgi:hypothetical protein
LVNVKETTMRRTFAVLGCTLLFATSLSAQDVPLFGWGGAPEHLGGLMVVRQGGQTSVSWGGILFNRRVKVTNATPDGPVVTRFLLPSALHSPTAVPVPGMSPGYLQVTIPDQFGLVYIDGEMIRTPGGLSRQLESQPLVPGKSYPMKVRGVYAVGNQLLIEEKTINLTAGQAAQISFDGQGAIAVPLPRETTAVRK